MEETKWLTKGKIITFVVLILLIVAIIPVINIAIGFITIVILIMHYYEQLYKFRGNNKIWNFLNKRI